MADIFDPKDLLTREVMMMGRPAYLRAAQSIHAGDDAVMLIVYDMEPLVDLPHTKQEMHERRFALYKSEDGRPTPISSGTLSTRWLSRRKEGDPDA